MGLTIEGGTGNGYSAGVTSENRLLTDCVTKSIEHQTNHTDGKSFSIPFSATPTASGDCFFLMKNEDDLDIVIEGVNLYLPAAEYFDIKIGDTGTPIDGTDITPVNLNAGSGILADGTFQQGNNITGLSGGSTAYRIHKLAGTGTENHNFEQDIILPKNTVLTMYVQTGTTALDGFIDFYYHDEG